MKLSDLRKYRKKEDFGIEDLVLAAAEIIPELVGEQTRYKVTERPDIRTIRFYVSEGVLDKPLRYEGTRALYGYRHLLQLLVIKYFQSESLPIRKIREIIKDEINEELEQMLAPLTQRKKVPRMPFEALQMPSAVEAFSLREPTRKRHFDMLSPLQRYLSKRPGRVSYEPATIGPYMKTSERDDKKGQRYERYEVEPGLEVNISEDFKLPKDSASQRILLTKITKILTDLGERRKE